mmetsp:Transcript_66820/g.186709  ORF Transcript_66820/g.186709 Transcript_66820/m.186709 type:complete len:412 (-) Transcript_66820:24-1259(-)
MRRVHVMRAPLLVSLQDARGRGGEGAEQLLQARVCQRPPRRVQRRQLLQRRRPGVAGVAGGARGKEHLDAKALRGGGGRPLIFVESEDDLREVVVDGPLLQRSLDLPADDPVRRALLLVVAVALRACLSAGRGEVTVPQHIHQGLNVALGREVQSRPDSPVRAPHLAGEARVQPGELCLLAILVDLRVLLDDLGRRRPPRCPRGTDAVDDHPGGAARRPPEVVQRRGHVPGGQLLGLLLERHGVAEVNQKLSQQLPADDGADLRATLRFEAVLAGDDDVGDLLRHLPHEPEVLREPRVVDEIEPDRIADLRKLGHVPDSVLLVPQVLAQLQPPLLHQHRLRDVAALGHDLVHVLELLAQVLDVRLQLLDAVQKDRHILAAAHPLEIHGVDQRVQALVRKAHRRAMREPRRR